MNSEEEKRVLVVMSKFLLSPQDRESIRNGLRDELEDGVVLLPPDLEFCCLVSADEVYLMHDGLFPCDPDKNTKCKKSGCYRNGGDCYMTQFEEYRK